MRWLPIILPWALVVGLSACAVPVPPTGGPEDATPPAILESVPAAGAVRVQDARIRITFSEPIDRATFSRAWSITPDIPGSVDVDWSGRTVTLTFDAPLRAETTYILTIDTALRDIRRVALGQPVTLAFATGERLNQGVVAGHIVDPLYGHPVAGMDVFAWALTDTVGVSTPLYRSQSGRDGRFRFTNLSETEYLIAAFQDANRNRVLDVGERLAAPATERILADSSGGILPAPMYAVLPDTSSPELLRVRATTARDLVLRFNEQVFAARTEAPAASGWSVSDSSGTRTFAALVHASSDPLQWSARTDSLSPGTWFLKTTGGLVADSAGNALQGGSWPVIVRGTEPAAANPALLAVEPDSGGVAAPVRTLWPADSLRILLTAPLGTDANTDSDLLPFTVTDTTGVALPGTAIVQRSPVEWTLEPRPDRPFDVSGRVADSDTTFRFLPAAPDQLGELAGVLESPGRAILEIFDGDDLVVGRTEVPAGIQSFRVQRLPGGMTYRIRAFVDVDGNGAWTPGQVLPFRAAEPLLFAEGTDPVRARWESVRADTLRFDPEPEREPDPVPEPEE